MQPPTNPEPRGPSPAAGQPQNSTGWGQPNHAWGQVAGSWNQPQAGQVAPPAAPRISTHPETPGQEPVGPAPTPTITIDQFTPKRNRTGPIILVIVAVVVFAAILYLGTRPDSLSTTGASASASPTPTAPRTTPSLPTGGDFATSIRFQSDRVAGNFSIENSRWEGSTLVVEVTVAVERGQLNYQFLSMDMTSGDVALSDDPTTADELRGGTIQAGEQVNGSVRFTKERGDTQILLGDVNGRNLTMLAVKG